MQKFFIFIVVSGLFCQNSFAEYTGVGGYANTGFEKMTCQKIIQQNLGLQVENTQKMMASRDELIKKCKPNGIISSAYKNITGEKEKCLKALNEIDNIIQTETDFFMKAVRYRIQMYDIQNLPKALFLSTCDLNARNIHRAASSDNDYNYLQNRLNNCLLKHYNENELSVYYDKNHKNNDFKDRQVCQKLINDYDQANSEPFLKFTQKEPSQRSAVKRECMSLNCQEVREKRFNLASDCYRDAFVTCMTTSEEYTPGVVTTSPISARSGQ